MYISKCKNVAKYINMHIAYVIICMYIIMHIYITYITIYLHAFINIVFVKVNPPGYVFVCQSLKEKTVSLHTSLQKNKIVKITNLLVSTVARNNRKL